MKRLLLSILLALSLFLVSAEEEEAILIQKTQAIFNDIETLTPTEMYGLLMFMSSEGKEVANLLVYITEHPDDVSPEIGFAALYLLTKLEQINAIQD